MPPDPIAPEAIEQLKQAIDANDAERVRVLMTADPALHRAPLGYGKDGPLTWVAECRVPWEPPGKARVAHGADVNALWHGHYPIVFAPCESLDPEALLWLLRHGADPNPPSGAALD